MTNITLLIVQWDGQGRTEEEQLPIETSVYNQFQEILRDSLDGRMWWDFNGKHGHVAGELIIEDYTLEEAILKYNEGDLDDSFHKCYDYLDDDLSQDDKDVIIQSSKRVYELISQQNNIMNATFDLGECDDKDKFLLRLSQLCDFYSVKMSDKN